MFEAWIDAMVFHDDPVKRQPFLAMADELGKAVEGIGLHLAERIAERLLELDDLVAESSKEDLVECARVLALNLAQYKQDFGELPQEGYKKLRTAKSIDEKTPKLVASGMLEMAIALAKATGRLKQE